MPRAQAELHARDVPNVFICTGYARGTHQYFTKASPVLPGAFIEFLAEIDLSPKRWRARGVAVSPAIQVVLVLRRLTGNERAIFNALPATRRHSRESGNPSSALSRASDMDPGFRRGDE